jgi:hypothetical protein
MQKNQKNPKHRNPVIEKELNLLKEDQEKDKKYLENLKQKIAIEIKTANLDQIKNTEIIEKKYTIWQRLKKVLGMN